MNEYVLPELTLIAYIFPSCRSWACNHAEDGDSRLHATSHPGDAGELRRSGKRSRRRTTQRRPPRQLQPQPVPQLCPKQSSYTIAVVTAHVFIFIFSLCCALSPPINVLKRRGEGGGSSWPLTAEHRRPAEPTTSSPTTKIPISWSAFPSLWISIQTWGEMRLEQAGVTGCLQHTTP